MQNVNVNFRANVNVRGMNAAPRNEDSALLAEIALRQGGMRADAGMGVRGSGVRANITMRTDSYGSARGAAHGGSLGVTGMGDLSAQVSARYGQRGASFQFEAQVNKQNFKARMNGANNLRNQAEIAVNMGMLQPGQGVQFQAQINNFSNFANFQIGGGPSADALFQNNINMMLGQQQMGVQLQQQGNMLQSLGFADAMLQQQLGMQQQAFGAFQGQVSEQFGMIGQALGQIGQHDAQQDQMLMAHSNGLGQLTGDLMQLGKHYQGLSGVVDGLGSKLGGLEGLFTQYRTDNDAKLATMGASTDTRFAGVQDQLSKLMGELNSLRTELAAAKKETSDLRGTLGTETVRLDTKIDTLAGRVEAGFKDVKGQLDTAVSSITTRLDKEIAGLQASQTQIAKDLRGEIAGIDAKLTTAVGDMKTQLEGTKKELTLKLDTAVAKLEAGQSELAKNLRGEIAGLDAKLTTATGELKTQLETQKKELTLKLDTEVAKLEAADAKLAADLKSLRGEYEGFAKQTQESLAAQSKRIDGAYKEINDTKTQLQGQLKDVETKLSAAIAAGDANLQAQLNNQKTQITNIMVQVNSHEVKINSHEATLKAHSSQINAAMSTATQALTTAKDAKGLAAGLQAQVNQMKGDINQLQANDHSFSTLLNQWWGALEKWHGSHFLVNQGMQGNAHTRFDPIEIKFGAKAFGENDFNADVTTKMVTGQDTKLKWPADNANIGALVVNPAELKKLGYTLMNARGEEITELTMAKDGLRVKGPDGKETITSDGWSLLKALDANSDGKINRADPAVAALTVWFDNGGTKGAIDANDILKGFLDAGIAELGVTGAAERTDKFGNTFKDGTITMANGTDAAVTDRFAGQGA